MSNMQSAPRRIVFFNGPPRSGKDTACGLMGIRTQATQVSFAEPLKLQTAALLGVSLRELEAIKDLPHPALKGGTPRQYMINLSEKMIKPCYGDDFFGHVAVNKIDNTPNILSDLVMFSDSGFRSEAEPVVSRFGLGNCTKIEIEREGSDFSKDSRSYWSMPGLRTVRLANNGHMEDFREAIENYLRGIGFI